MVYKLFDRKTGSEASVNEELAQELHKPVIKKFKRRNVYTKFKDIIWAADSAEMGSLPSFNLGVYLLKFCYNICYNLVKYLLYVNKSKRKPNKLWVDQGSELYDNLAKMAGP